LTALVRALRYVDYEIINDNQESTVHDILKHCLYQSIPPQFSHIVEPIIEKLQKVNIFILIYLDSKFN